MAVSFLMTLLASILLLASPASAHRIDESYIYMDIYDTEVEGRLEFRIVDVNAQLGLDIPDEVLKEVTGGSARMSSSISGNVQRLGRR